MMIFPLLFLIFLIVMLVLVFRGGGSMCGHHETHAKDHSAREILDQRYARGEINQQEYQQMRKDIE
ncbi:MAG: SHOCT domain-containing protein [Planctomycetia bacterium]|nr:SHOCT domain-containing protein [Planctomycetia bacterium]